jgi:hypothetical protein
MKSKFFSIVVLILVAAFAQPVRFAAQQTVSATNGQIAFTQGVLDFNGGAPSNSATVRPFVALWNSLSVSPSLLKSAVL